MKQLFAVFAVLIKQPLEMLISLKHFTLTSNQTNIVLTIIRFTLLFGFFNIINRYYNILTLVSPFYYTVY